MNPKQDRLIQTAAQLYTLGLDVEEAREELRRLVSRKVPYACPSTQYSNEKGRFAA